MLVYATSARRMALAISGAFLLLGPVAVGQNPDQAAEPIRVDVKLVLLPTRVADASGRPILDLARTDFRILEDEQEQKLEFFSLTSEPAHIAILVDVSGSTAQLLPELRLAAERFVDRFNEHDRIAAYAFDSRVTRVCEFTGDLKKVKRIISWMHPHDGAPSASPDHKEATVVKEGNEDAGTVLYDAIAVARSEFPPDARKRAVLVFTDSWDVGSETSFDSVAWQLLRGSEMLFAVVADLRETEGLEFLKRPWPLRNPPKKEKSDKGKGKPMSWSLVFDLSGTSSEGIEAFDETARHFLDNLSRKDRVWIFVNRQKLQPLFFPSFDGRPARVRPLTPEEARQLLVMLRAPRYSFRSFSDDPVRIEPDGVLLLTDPNETGLADLARFVDICPILDMEKCPVAVVKPLELSAEERKAIPYTLVNDPDARAKLAQRAFASVIRLMETRMSNLARQSGGDAFQIRRAGDLKKTYQQIADQIRSSFLLGYYTLGAPGPRRLQVAVPGRTALVKSREVVIVE